LLLNGDEPSPAVVADDGTLVADATYDAGDGDGERFGLVAEEDVVLATLRGDVEGIAGRGGSADGDADDEGDCRVGVEGPRLDGS
jgi:hypothetical protein